MAKETDNTENTKVQLSEYQLNLDMWRHYDTLRQEKNKVFLTANTILVAAVGIVWEKQSSLPYPLILLVSLLGIIVCGLWILLLSRNAAYIAFHRERVMSLEQVNSMHFTTFSKDWKPFEKELPRWQKLSSNLADRLLAASFALFFIVVFACDISKACGTSIEKSKAAPLRLTQYWPRA